MGEICYRFMRLVCHRVIYRQKFSNLLITGNTAFFFQSFDTLFIVVLYCPPGRGGGHFQSKVIGMLVVFLGYKILILVFFNLGSSGKFLKNGSHFSQNSPQNSSQNCNFGIF